jgi:hypothetical protein
MARTLSAKIMACQTMKLVIDEGHEGFQGLLVSGVPLGQQLMNGTRGQLWHAHPERSQMP